MREAWETPQIDAFGIERLVVIALPVRQQAVIADPRLYLQPRAHMYARMATFSLMLGLYATHALAADCSDKYAACSRRCDSVYTIAKYHDRCEERCGGALDRCTAEEAYT